MKPPRFEYHRAEEVGEALALLGRYGGEARVLAGGQSLMADLNARRVRPRALVDVNRIPALTGVAEDIGGGLRVGATTRQRAVERDSTVAALCPLLVDALRHVGSLQTRNRGTVGGSMAHADPSAELPAVALALEAAMVVQGPGGEREIAAADFFTGPGATAVAAGELLVAVRFPPSTGRCALREITVRGQGGPALVAVAVADGRIALAGVGPTPVRAHRAEAVLAADGIAAAAQAAAEDVEPTGDFRAGAGYRRSVAEVLTRRALEAAVA